MGLLAELVMGTETFAFASLLAFALTTAMDLLRGVSSAHGASGIFWSYHVFAFFFFIAPTLGYL